MNHILTKEGRDKLLEELEHLKNVARKDVIERVLIAKEHGDLKENSEYHQAKEEQGVLESRVAEIEYLIKHAEIIDESAIPHHKVGVGTTFKARFGDNEMEFMIVGPEEVDPGANKISYESPLGKAFMNRQVGEKVVIKAPAGEFEYEIVKIR
ncbi:MAG: transcription elongation factor GreA [bacterium]|nr:transcription elongation factor GreA [bacterium]